MTVEAAPGRPLSFPWCWLPQAPRTHLGSRVTDSGHRWVDGEAAAEGSILGAGGRILAKRDGLSELDVARGEPQRQSFPSPPRTVSGKAGSRDSWVEARGERDARSSDRPAAAHGALVGLVHVDPRGRCAGPRCDCEETDQLPETQRSGLLRPCATAYSPMSAGYRMRTAMNGSIRTGAPAAGTHGASLPGSCPSTAHARWHRPRARAGPR
jgi:hypothetical protein